VTGSVLPLQETEQLASDRALEVAADLALTASLAARDLDLCDEPAGGVQDRDGVAVAVRVDPDDMLDPAL
jgi:hypothetical protein